MSSNPHRCLLAPCLFAAATWLPAGCSQGVDQDEPEGDAGSQGGDGGSQMEGREPGMLPAAPESCPSLEEGEVMFGASKVQVWVGSDGMSKLGPLVIYWHGTCGNPLDGVRRGIGEAGIARIKELGGMVAAIESSYKSPNNFCQLLGLPATTVCPGDAIGNGVWCHEDFDVADDIVACAIQQVGIDVRRIHTAGMSAGGVTAAAYGYARSGYLASLATYSGGGVASVISPNTQDPSNKFAVMIVHGGPTDGVGAANFETIGQLYQNELTTRGHFSFVCDHGMGHVVPAGVGDSTVEFFEDHPFGVSPEPYAAALPVSFPAYCTLP